MTHKLVDGKVVRRSIAEAKQLLAEAGYPDGRDAEDRQAAGAELRLLRAGHARAQARDRLGGASQFAKIDIQLEVRATDNNQFQDKVRKGKYQVFWLGWLADYPDAENFLFLLYGPNGKTKSDGENTSNYDNPEYDRLFAQHEVAGRRAREAAADRRAWWRIVQRGRALDAWATSPMRRRRVPAVGAQRQAGDPGARPWAYYLRLDVASAWRRQAEWNRPVWWPLIGLARGWCWRWCGWRGAACAGASAPTRAARCWR